MLDQVIASNNTFVSYLKNLLMDIATNMGNDREKAKEFARDIMSLFASTPEEKIREICGKYEIFY